MARPRWYVGRSVGQPYRAFLADHEPTCATYGDQVHAVIGPFRTERAAKWAEKYGASNPHFRHFLVLLTEAEMQDAIEWLADAAEDDERDTPGLVLLDALVAAQEAGNA